MIKKHKKLKKALISALVIVGVFGIIWGGLVLIRNARRDTVKVFSVSDFMITDMGSSAGTSGTVKADKLQKVRLSETQTVKDIFVKEGDAVHKGDKLISCDTQLSNADLSAAQAELNNQQIELKRLNAQLESLSKEKTADQLEAERAALEKKLAAAQKEAGITDDANKPVLPEGDGSKKLPICVVWDEENDKLTQSTLNEMLGEKKSAYVLLVNDNGEEYTVIQGLYLSRDKGSEEVSLSFTSELSIPEISKTDTVKKLEKQIEDIELKLADAHTGAEIQKLKREKSTEIANAKIDIQIASIKLRQLQSEIQDGVVYSDIEGTVKVVRSEEEARAEGTPIIEVSGGGGYYIDGAISELALGTVEVGQTVDIYSYFDDTNCTGEITEISTDPATAASSWSEGNPNVSYYSMKVFVDEDANLVDGDMVNMSYSTRGNENAWYIEKMFVRSENGISYVYVRDGKDALVKRNIQVGTCVNGYVEILDGLSADDYIAFPYGKDVVVGAKTREATMDELYQ